MFSTKTSGHNRCANPVVSQRYFVDEVQSNKPKPIAFQ